MKVVHALQREVSARPDWSPGFFERLASSQPALDVAADETVFAIQRQRRSEKLVQF
jgi:hypothetical protein